MCCLLAVVVALKTLQEKIRCLELEKSQAEDNLCSLSIAAAQYKKALERESHKKDIAHRELMQQSKGIARVISSSKTIIWGVFVCFDKLLIYAHPPPFLFCFKIGEGQESDNSKSS